MSSEVFSFFGTPLRGEGATRPGVSGGVFSSFGTPLHVSTVLVCSFGTPLRGERATRPFTALAGQQALISYVPAGVVFGLCGARG